MATLFGQFLTDTHLITPDQLLEALVHQLKSTPSTAEMLYELDLIPKGDQLKILAHQQIHGMDYCSSAKDLGLWSETLTDQISASTQKKRRPLGEVLVTLGYLTSDTLKQALDSYVAASSKSIEAPLTKPAVDHSTMLDPILCQEYAQNLQTKILPALRALVAGSPPKTRDEIDQFLRKALPEISAVRAAATFVAARRSMQLAEDLRATIVVLKKSSDLPSASDLIDMFRFSAHVFDGLGQMIQHFHSEDDFSSDVNLKDLFERVQNLQELLRSQAVQSRAA